MKVAASMGLFLTFSAAHACAQDLVYTPVNPSFGGNPLNSGHLLGIASAQRTATAFDHVEPSTSATPTSNTRSQTDLFVAQLESRLMSALSSQVVEAIFGDDPQDNGSVVFGTTTIEFNRSNSDIALTIIDSLDGSVTEISVPILIAN